MAYISMSYQPAGLLTDQASAAEVQALPLDALSRRLQLSCQTLVRWVDRHLIDATLRWRLDGDEEVRVIELSDETLHALVAFAREYRADAVSCAEARGILKIIDRKRVKKMLRADDITAVEVGGERHVLVGSIEDYLMEQEERGVLA